MKRIKGLPRVLPAGRAAAAAATATAAAGGMRVRTKNGCFFGERIRCAARAKNRLSKKEKWMPAPGTSWLQRSFYMHHTPAPFLTPAHQHI
jgi:hypothetical protein